MASEIIWKDRKRTFLGLPWSFTRYRLSNECFIIERGFFNIKEDEVRLYRITDISLSRSFGQRMFGLGTIRCCSADKTLGDFEIKNIKNPKVVRELLSETVEKERTAKRVISKEDFTHNHDVDEDGIDDEHEA